MKVTHKQIVSGMTTAGPLAVLISRFILWVNGESVENELVAEINRIDTEREAALTEVNYLKGLLNARYESEWKLTKDGTRRYRKVATKVLADRWITESQPIEQCIPCPGGGVPLHGQLFGTDTVVMDIDWSTLEEEFDKATA